MFYFKYFDVRPYQLPESFCNYDWLELHDGNSTDNQYVCGMYLYNVVVAVLYGHLLRNSAHSVDHVLSLYFDYLYF